MIVAKALLRHDFEVVRGADRLGQREFAVAVDAQMGFQLFLGQVLETAVVDGGRSTLVEYATKELLQEAPLNLLNICSGETLRGQLLGVLTNRRSCFGQCPARQPAAGLGGWPAPWPAG